MCVLALGAAFVDLVALWVWGVRCDETCSPHPPPGRPVWRSDEDAWQWDAQLALMSVVLLLTLAAIRFAARGRLRSAVVTAAIATTSAAAWIAFVWN